MKKALHAVRNLSVTQKQAATDFNIPRQTLRRPLSGINKISKQGEKRFRRPPVLTSKPEKVQAGHILHLESMLCGLS